jgi:hypothetical protein
MLFATRSTWRARAPTIGGLTQDGSRIDDARSDDAAAISLGHSASAEHRGCKADDDDRVGLNSGGNLGSGANGPGHGEIDGGKTRSSTVLSGGVASRCDAAEQAAAKGQEGDPTTVCASLEVLTKPIGTELARPARMDKYEKPPKLPSEAAAAKTGCDAASETLAAERLDRKTLSAETPGEAAPLLAPVPDLTICAPSAPLSEVESRMATLVEATSPSCDLMAAADQVKGSDQLYSELLPPTKSSQMTPGAPPGGHQVDDTTVLAAPPGGRPDEPTDRPHSRESNHMGGDSTAMGPGSGLDDPSVHGENPSAGLMNPQPLNATGQADGFVKTTGVRMNWRTHARAGFDEKCATANSNTMVSYRSDRKLRRRNHGQRRRIKMAKRRARRRGSRLKQNANCRAARRRPVRDDWQFCWPHRSGAQRRRPTRLGQPPAKFPVMTWGAAPDGHVLRLYGGGRTKADYEASRAMAQNFAETWAPTLDAALVERISDATTFKGDPWTSGLAFRALNVARKMKVTNPHALAVSDVVTFIMDNHPNDRLHSMLRHASCDDEVAAITKYHDDSIRKRASGLTTARVDTDEPPTVNLCDGDDDAGPGMAATEGNGNTAERHDEGAGDGNHVSCFETAIENAGGDSMIRDTLVGEHQYLGCPELTPDGVLQAHVRTVRQLAISQLALIHAKSSGRYRIPREAQAQVRLDKARVLRVVANYTVMLRTSLREVVGQMPGADVEAALNASNAQAQAKGAAAAAADCILAELRRAELDRTRLAQAGQATLARCTLSETHHHVHSFLTARERSDSSGPTSSTAGAAAGDAAAEVERPASNAEAHAEDTNEQTPVVGAEPDYLEPGEAALWTPVPGKDRTWERLTKKRLIKLYVGASEISGAGDGLFTRRRIAPGTSLGRLYGRVLFAGDAEQAAQYEAEAAAQSDRIISFQPNRFGDWVVIDMAGTVFEWLNHADESDATVYVSPRGRVTVRWEVDPGKELTMSYAQGRTFPRLHGGAAQNDRQPHAPANGHAAGTGDCGARDGSETAAPNAVSNGEDARDVNTSSPMTLDDTSADEMSTDDEQSRDGGAGTGMQLFPIDIPARQMASYLEAPIYHAVRSKSDGSSGYQVMLSDTLAPGVIRFHVWGYQAIEADIMEDLRHCRLDRAESIQSTGGATVRYQMALEALSVLSAQKVEAIGEALASLLGVTQPHPAKLLLTTTECTEPQPWHADSRTVGEISIIMSVGGMRAVDFLQANGHPHRAVLSSDRTAAESNGIVFAGAICHRGAESPSGQTIVTTADGIAITSVGLHMYAGPSARPGVYTYHYVNANTIDAYMVPKQHTSVALQPPDFTRPFMVNTDASAVGASAFLVQTDDEGIERQIASRPRVYSTVEQVDGTCDRERRAAHDASLHFRPYLTGQYITIYLDDLVRYSTSHTQADALSRLYPPVHNRAMRVRGGAPNDTSTFTSPTLAQRRAEASATWAHFANVVTRATTGGQGESPDLILPCFTCGAVGNADWCNQCELEGNHPLKADGLVTPMCRSCLADNVECRVCATRPSEAPSDSDMSPATLESLHVVAQAHAVRETCACPHGCELSPPEEDGFCDLCGTPGPFCTHDCYCEPECAGPFCGDPSFAESTNAVGEHTPQALRPRGSGKAVGKKGEVSNGSNTFDNLEVESVEGAESIGEEEDASDEGGTSEPEVDADHPDSDANEAGNGENDAVKDNQHEAPEAGQEDPVIEPNVDQDYSPYRGPCIPKSITDKFDEQDRQRREQLDAVAQLKEQQQRMEEQLKDQKTSSDAIQAGLREVERRAAEHADKHDAQIKRIDETLRESKSTASANAAIAKADAAIAKADIEARFDALAALIKSTAANPGLGERVADRKGLTTPGPKVTEVDEAARRDNPTTTSRHTAFKPMMPGTSRFQRARAMTEERAPSDDDVPLALLVVVTNLEESVTVTPCTHEYGSWAAGLHRRDGIEIDTALFSMPLVVEQDTQSFATRMRGWPLATSVQVRVYRFRNVMGWSNGAVQGVVRVDVALNTDESDATILSNMWHESLDDATVQRYTLRELTNPVQLQHTAMAASATLSRSAIAIELCSIAQTLLNAASSPPLAPLTESEQRAAAGQRYGQYRPPRSHLGSELSHTDKRLSWKKTPTMDIAEVLPKWDPPTISIQQFQHKLVTALHTATDSKIPELLGEQNPISVIMQVIIKLHNTNSFAAAQFGNSSVAESVRVIINDLELKHRAHVEEARTAPYDVTQQQRVVDIICSGLAELRGLYHRTSLQGALQMEVSHLLREVSTMEMSNGEAEYIFSVDSFWTMFEQLWGDKITLSLMTNGPLTQFLPQVVERLSPSMRDRALDFFNDLIRTYQSENVRSVMPAQISARLDEAIAQYSKARPTAPALARLGAAVGDARAMSSYQAVFDMELQHNRSLHVLTVPADLNFVATTGLLLSHWRPFVQKLVGNHRQSWRAPANLFAVNGEYQDSSDDEADSTAHINVQTRSGSHGRTSTTGGARRTRFDPQALEKFERRAAKASETLQQGAAGLEEKLDKKIGDMKAFFEKNVDALRAEQKLQTSRANGELAHWAQTLEKAVHNIAQHSGGMTHATQLAETASKIGAEAKRYMRESASTMAVARSRPLEARGQRLDANGMKLSHLPTNDFDKLSDEVKSIYASRDNVRSKSDFTAIAERKCRNCPDDAWNMPHAEGKCPFIFMNSEGAAAKIDKVKLARQRKRLLDNVERLKGGKPADTLAALVAVATAMQETEDIAEVVEACNYVADVCSIGDHTSVDTFMAEVDELCEKYALNA